MKNLKKVRFSFQVDEVIISRVQSPKESTKDFDQIPEASQEDEEDNSREEVDEGGTE